MNMVISPLAKTAEKGRAGAAYLFKTRADYAVGSTATPISAAEAAAAIATTTRFNDTAQLLPPGIAP
jgi:hypothetical protein